MRSNLIAFVVTALVMCACDFLWLGAIAGDFYRARIGALMLEQPRIDAAVAFYVCYALGLVVLAVRPALRAASWKTAAGLGAMVGFTAYAAYDLTNLATLKHWPVLLSVVDMAWGVGLSAVATIAAFYMARRFG